MAKKPSIPKVLEKQDPDSWLRKLHTPDAINKWMATEKDYISDYMVTLCSARATGPKGVAEQVTIMGELLELIPDDIVRNCYYDEVGKSWPAFKKNYKLHKRESAVTLPKLEKLNKEDKAAFFEWGFFEEDGALYTMGQSGKVRICNFTIEILYFVRSNNEPKYVCLFKSRFGLNRISAITTDDFVTVGTFKKCCGRLNLVFEGNDVQLNKLKLKLFHGVKEAEEPRFMGYNQNGDFYTWANGLYYDKKFYKTDKYGMVEIQHPIRSMDDFKNLPPESQVMMADELHILENAERFIEKNGEDAVSQYIAQNQAKHLSYYFLPFSTRLKVTEHDDDDFEFERRFKHTPPKGDLLSFERWASLMEKAYGANGCVAVVFYCMCLFRDIVFKHNNSYMPMLGMFGPRGSGKSKCAGSIEKMFGEGTEDGINLESGSTATGIRRYLAGAQNAILFLNEYKNHLPDSTLGMIKGIADGSGKLTGRNTGGNETKTYKPRSAAIIAGQDVPTKDPAIIMRMIVCEFDAKDRNYDAYHELKKLEKERYTTSVTLEVLNYRDEVKRLFAKCEVECTKIFREEITTQLKQDAEDRIVLNNSSLLATYEILSQAGLKFPITREDLIVILLEKIDVQIGIQQTSDDVEQYFNVIQSLIDSGQIREEEHYKITKDSSGMKKLWLRVRPINPTYMAAAQRAGMAAMTLGTVTQYLNKHKSFIEYKKDGVPFSRFGGEGGGRTSAHVFNYDILLAQGIEFRSNTAEPLMDL